MLANIQNIFNQASWDILALFGLFGVVLLYALLNRRNHLLALVFSLYISQLVFENFHLLDRFLGSETASATDVFYFQAALYSVIIALVATIIYKKAFGDGGPRFMLWKIAVMTVLATGLFVNSFLRLLPIDEFYKISSLLSRVFVGENQTILWLTLPIIALLVIIRRS